MELTTESSFNDGVDRIERRWMSGVLKSMKYGCAIPM
jgi:hypothetical protein